jgi:hypothetical protein
MKTMKITEHFQTGSALLEFLAGRLGAPECWPSDRQANATIDGVRRTQHVTRSRLAASYQPKHLHSVNAGT